MVAPGEEGKRGTSSSIEEMDAEVGVWVNLNLDGG